MKERRWPWTVSGLSLTLAAVTGAVATYLWWLPCRGRMLVGTAFGPTYSDALLGDGCIDRMNEGTPYPLPTEAAWTAPGLLALSTLTMILVAVAWVVPVAVLPMTALARAGIAVPGVTVALVALMGVATALGPESVEPLAYLLDFLLNISAVVGLGLLIAARAPGLARFVLVAVCVSAFGFFGMIGDYMIMVHWSDASWDSPPGSGYLTAALLLVCGVAVLIMTALSRQSRPMAEPVELEEVGA